MDAHRPRLVSLTLRGRCTQVARNLVTCRLQHRCTLQSLIVLSLPAFSLHSALRCGALMRIPQTSPSPSFSQFFPHLRAFALPADVPGIEFASVILPHSPGVPSRKCPRVEGEVAAFLSAYFSLPPSRGPFASRGLLSLNPAVAFRSVFPTIAPG